MIHALLPKPVPAAVLRQCVESQCCSVDTSLEVSTDMHLTNLVQVQRDPQAQNSLPSYAAGKILLQDTLNVPPGRIACYNTACTFDSAEGLGRQR